MSVELEQVTALRQMERAEVVNRLTAILAEILVLNQEDIKTSSKLVDDLDADSIAFLELSYRIRHDFGLEMPEAKANEEMLRMPLEEGLKRLEAEAGGTSLFEFMKREMLLMDSGGGEVQAALAQMVVAGLRDDDLRARVREVAQAAGERPEAARSLGRLVRDVRRTSSARQVLEAVLNQDLGFAADLIALEELVAGDEQPADAGPILALWRGQSTPALGGGLSVGHLATLMGTEPPKRYEAGAALTTLKLRDLFAFITVESYVRYILYLAGQPVGPAPVADHV